MVNSCIFSEWNMLISWSCFAWPCVCCAVCMCLYTSGKMFSRQQDSHGILTQTHTHTLLETCGKLSYLFYCVFVLQWHLHGNAMPMTLQCVWRGMTMSLTCRCHVAANALPWQCHWRAIDIFLARRCHVTATALSGHWHVVAISRHVIAMSLACPLTC